MLIHLLRHAPAEPRETSVHLPDAKRPLTAKGEKKMKRIAQACVALDLRPAFILTSSYLRCRATAEILGKALKVDVSVSKELRPDGHPKILISRLAKLREIGELVLVGHEPYLSRLTSILICGDKEATVDFKKGSLCTLEVETLTYGRCATLKSLITPEQAAFIAKGD